MVNSTRFSLCAPSPSGLLFGKFYRRPSILYSRIFRKDEFVGIVKEERLAVGITGAGFEISS